MKKLFKDVLKVKASAKAFDGDFVFHEPVHIYLKVNEPQGAINVFLRDEDYMKWSDLVTEMESGKDVHITLMDDDTVRRINVNKVSTMSIEAIDPDTWWPVNLKNDERPYKEVN